jgi:glycosyltransferase involved in cell wall biosynthesis
VGKLKVLQIGKFYPPHMGGIETHLEGLCSELRKFVDLRVVVASDNKRTTNQVLDDVAVLRAGTICTLASAPICPQMVSQIRKAKADVVHLHLPNPAAVLAYLASRHRGPLILTYHSDTVRQKVLGRLFQPILYSVLHRSSAIIVSSPNYLESSPSLASYRDKCHIIPLAVRTGDFETPNLETIRVLRKKYGNRIVLSVGRLVQYKGFEYLIRAMAKVRGRLLIIGEGPLRNKLEILARTAGVCDRVSFLGEVCGSLAPYYHASDVFALASIARSEAFGIVQLEAMACGKPVVNTSLRSGVPFVSQNGVTGITVPPENADALAKAINSLLDEPLRCRKYGAAARRRVQQEFSLELMAQRTQQLYQDVIGSSSAPAHTPTRDANVVSAYSEMDVA